MVRESFGALTTTRAGVYNVTTPTLWLQTPATDFVLPLYLQVTYVPLRLAFNSSSAQCKAVSRLRRLRRCHISKWAMPSCHRLSTPRFPPRRHRVQRLRHPPNSGRQVATPPTPVLLPQCRPRTSSSSSSSSHDTPRCGVGRGAHRRTHGRHVFVRSFVRSKRVFQSSKVKKVPKVPKFRKSTFRNLQTTVLRLADSSNLGTCKHCRSD